MAKKLLPFFIVAAIFLPFGARAVVLQGYQGGTGLGPTSTATSTGLYLQITSTTPFLTWGLGSGGTGGGAATTTINGAQCPTFTLSIVATTSQSSITTSSCNIFFNELKYTSGTDINVAANGVINFVNTPGFISAAILTINGNSTAAQTLTGGTGISVASAGGNTTTTNTGVTSLTGSGCVTNGGNSTGTLTLGVTCISANQSITVTATGDVTSTGSGATSITLPSHVVAIQGFSVSSTAPTNGQVLQYVSSTATYVPTTPTSGGTVAGSDTQVQYNNGGTFGATTTLTYTSSTNTLKVPNLFINNSFVGSGTPTFSNASSVTLSGNASWTVPNGVTQITIVMQGAAGGGLSSLGGASTGTLAVTPGTIYWYCVGSVGGTSGGGGGSSGGSCGGGAGSGGSVAGGDGGGGATWFSTSSTFTTSTVVEVAGGGGGGIRTSVNGGSGGGLAGVNGNNQFGVGGSQSSGGAGGTGINGGANGTNGIVNTGGAGGSSSGGPVGAGGGGGGYYGGGGGGGDGGGTGNSGTGGGGSGYVLLSLTNATTTSGVNNSNGSLMISFSSTITGNDVRGSTVLVTSATTGTITFAQTHLVAPVCDLIPNNATNTYWDTVTTTTLSFTFQNAIVGGAGFSYICIP